MVRKQPFVLLWGSPVLGAPALIRRARPADSVGLLCVAYRVLPQSCHEACVWDLKDGPYAGGEEERLLSLTSC